MCKNFAIWLVDDFKAEPFKGTPFLEQDFSPITAEEREEWDDYIVEHYGATDSLATFIEDWGQTITDTIRAALSKEALAYATMQAYRFNHSLHEMVLNAKKDDTRTFAIAEKLRRKWTSYILEEYAKRVKELGFDEKKKGSKKCKSHL